MSSPTEAELEVCCSSADCACAALSQHAPRIELCTALQLGGLTPTMASLEQVLKHRAKHAPSAVIAVLIRPRSGDFLYSTSEWSLLLSELRAVRALVLQHKCTATDAIVCGALTASGDIDAARCAELVQASAPLELTFHRAFDCARAVRGAELTRIVIPQENAAEDATSQLRVLLECGVHRLLTSGRQSSVSTSAAHLCIEHLCAYAHQYAAEHPTAQKLTIMAGGGLQPESAALMLRTTPCRAFHASCTSFVPSGMLYRSVHLKLSSMLGEMTGDFMRQVLCELKLKHMLSAVRGEQLLSDALPIESGSPPQLSDDCCAAECDSD